MNLFITEIRLDQYRKIKYHSTYPVKTSNSQKHTCIATSPWQCIAYRTQSERHLINRNQTFFFRLSPRFRNNYLSLDQVKVYQINAARHHIPPQTTTPSFPITPRIIGWFSQLVSTRTIKAVLLNFFSRFITVNHLYFPREIFSGNIYSAFI